MSTNATALETTRTATDRADGATLANRVASLLAQDWLVPPGRVLFAAIFLVAGLGHFSPQTIGYAAQTGVPLAGVLVPVSGLMSMAGALSIMLGWHARMGAALLVLFLVPVTVMMHAFWTVPDPMQAQVEQAMFMKNVGLLGGALLIAYFGAGPLSLDARRDGAGGRAR
jgi:putative oxidoreductase